MRFFSMWDIYFDTFEPFEYLIQNSSSKHTINVGTSLNYDSNFGSPCCESIAYFVRRNLYWSKNTYL